MLPAGGLFIFPSFFVDCDFSQCSVSVALTCTSGRGSGDLRSFIVIAP